jgi:hypothetical protein
MSQWVWSSLVAYIQQVEEEGEEVEEEEHLQM